MGQHSNAFPAFPRSAQDLHPGRGQHTRTGINKLQQCLLHTPVPYRNPGSGVHSQSVTHKHHTPSAHHPRVGPSSTPPTVRAFSFASIQSRDSGVFSFSQHLFDFVCSWRFAQLGLNQHFRNRSMLPHPAAQGAWQRAEFHLTCKIQDILQHLAQSLMNRCRFSKNHWM